MERHTWVGLLMATGIIGFFGAGVGERTYAATWLCQGNRIVRRRGRGYANAMAEISYRRHRFPPVIIQHAVWLYLRFTLSYRDVEKTAGQERARHLL